MSRDAIKRASLEILEGIQPASVRAVCYKLFAAGFIPSMDKQHTGKVSKILTEARMEDFIPWEWIVDDTRKMEVKRTWTDKDEFLSEIQHWYARDYWKHQPVHVEVWAEKSTVRGTLAPILDKYRVPFRVNRGFASTTVIHDVAELTKDLGKPLVILYMGDWDCSGLYMRADLNARLLDHGAINYHFRYAALTPQQLPGLPSFDPKERDPNYGWFVDYCEKCDVDSQCYELDAMDPNDLRKRTEYAIEKFIDKPLWQEAVEIEREEIEDLREVNHEQTEEA